MNQTIGQTLTRLRTEQGLSQRELAAQLCAAGVQVSNQAVSKWENDSTQPSARQFLALLRMIILLIPIALVLPRIFQATGMFGLSGTDGLFYAEPIADVLASLTTGTIFFFYSKKLLKPVEPAENGPSFS